MAYDGFILAETLDKLEIIRDRNEEEKNRRLRRVYALNPKIEAIDRDFSRQMVKLGRLFLSGDTAGIEKLSRENQALQKQRAELLSRLGLNEDYTDDIYSCPLCKDSGTVDGKLCSCFKRIYNEELTKNLSGLLKTGSESFQNIDYSLFSDTDYVAGSLTNRAYFRSVASKIEDYANSFSPNSASWLFIGSPGLGKTYLCACVAKVVAFEKGHSVCYDSACTAFDAFEQRRFSRDEERKNAAERKIARMTDADLLILDDLGTEYISAGSLSAFYTLINTRLIENKPTIINTNLSVAEIYNRYGDATASRLSGEYGVIEFFGDDIRKNR